jgi:indole-3-glycerol phosphate synthase
MTILDKIVAAKRKEVAERKVQRTISDLEKMPYFERTTYSLKRALQTSDELGIIAEFKRHSPSKGAINTTVKVEDVTKGYVEAGAAALSILTDEPFFKGTTQDILAVRELNASPILRKDFTIDAYQLVEAKAIGADAILLIAECLTAAEVKALAVEAKALNLSVLIELHSADQLDKLVPEIDVVGVNNRNLKTFEVQIQTSMDLFEQIPSDFVKISESGINDPNVIIALRQRGFQGFLIGEYFMASDNPPSMLEAFIKRVKNMEFLLRHGIA